MTDSEIIIRPTQERLRLADHVADEGNPTKEQPYVRPARLGTAWDRYCRDRDKDGKLLSCEDMILTRKQIAAGEAYIDAVEGSLWGYPTGSKLEPGVSSSYKGPPATCVDRGIKVRELEDRLKPQYLVSLVQAVLFEGHSAETWAGATGRKANAGIHYLRLALDQMGDC